jgi:hypothetical protein
MCIISKITPASLESLHLFVHFPQLPPCWNTASVSIVDRRFFLYFIPSPQWKVWIHYTFFILFRHHSRKYGYTILSSFRTTYFGSLSHHLNIFVTSLFLRWGVVSPTPNPQAGGPLLVGCPRLLIEHIRSYPPYLEGVSSIRNLRTRHAVATRDPPIWTKER